MNPLDHHDLPAPPLDPARRDAILGAVLAERAARRTSQQRWLAPVGAAAAVGVVAVGGVALLDRDTEPPAVTGPSPTATPTSQEPTPPPEPDEQVEPFVLGSLGPRDADRVLEQCLPSFGYDPSSFEAVLAQRVAGPYGAQDVVIAEDGASGTQFFCSADQTSMIAGPDSKSLVRPPDDSHPLTRADVGGTSSSGGTGDLLVDAAFRVSDLVDRVEMRVGTTRDPGTWRSATPEGGFVYVAAWTDPAAPEGVDTFVETRAFDSAGEPIRSDLLGRSRVELVPMQGFE